LQKKLLVAHMADRTLLSNCSSILPWPKGFKKKPGFHEIKPNYALHTGFLQRLFANYSVKR